MLKLGKENKRLDLEVIQRGRSVECPLRPGVAFEIRPAHVANEDYSKALRVKAYHEQVEEKGEFASNAQWSMEFLSIPEVAVGALVGGITGIYDDEGAEVPYTPEIGLQVLGDPAHVDVLRWVVVEARKYADYYTQDLDADEGNSGRGSSGKQAGAGKSRKTRR